MDSDPPSDQASMDVTDMPGTEGWGRFGADAVLRVLMCRFGDGSVYIEDATDRPIYQAAQALGLISRDGYLTRAGRRFLSVHGRN